MNWQSHNISSQCLLPRMDEIYDVLLAKWLKMLDQSWEVWSCQSLSRRSLSNLAAYAQTLDWRLDTPHYSPHSSSKQNINLSFALSAPNPARQWDFSHSQNTTFADGVFFDASSISRCCYKTLLQPWWSQKSDNVVVGFLFDESFLSGTATNWFLRCDNNQILPRPFSKLHQVKCYNKTLLQRWKSD